VSLQQTDAQGRVVGESPIGRAVAFMAVYSWSDVPDLLEVPPAYSGNDGYDPDPPAADATRVNELVASRGRLIFFNRYSGSVMRN